MTELTDAQNYLAYINSLPFDTTIPSVLAGQNLNAQFPIPTGLFSNSYNAIKSLMDIPDDGFAKDTQMYRLMHVAINLTRVSPTPTWDQFVTNVEFALGNGQIPHTTATSANLLPAFLQDFQTALHISDDPGWDGLSPQPDANQFKAFFGHIMRTIDEDDSTQTPIFLFDTMGKVLAPVKSIGSDAVFFDYAGVKITPLPSYEDMFKGAFPGATDINFESFLQTFYAGRMAADGYFAPGVDFTAFQQSITAALNNPTIVDFYNHKTLASLQSKRLLVFNRVYSLIANLLNVMQGLTGAQASRLIVMSQWQKAYTDSIAQLHVFTSADPKPSDTTKRSDLNDFTNSNFRDIMRNNQQIVSDDAKSLQSSVNQSNDAVSQQANLATALIQELSSLLSAIFR